MMKNVYSSAELFVEFLISADLGTEYFNIAVIGLDKISGKLIFENKVTKTLHIANFCALNEPILRRTNICLTLSRSDAKFSMLKNGKLVATRVISSEVKDFQEQLRTVQDVFLTVLIRRNGA
ncbi:hypothetical protein [Mucilaginibacter sp. FT3.2]|uniref:hypothetical protein n=1 Tax=Mucilaginibacter sp. FT3.2 TaxID=2723090 RepID=UPI001621B60D|nr:hypothetical protein [Mucilaginibacter sp. FT3.2]MBB6235315.1 hypothetical protein [Mucilaginibacter sp. FT3.2]